MFFTVPALVFASPSVVDISGILKHGSVVNVNGIGFGNKSTVAPLVWDDCNGNMVTDKWSGAWPNAGTPEYQMQYTSPIRSVTLPHSHVTKYMAGVHGDSGGANDGYDVLVWKNITASYPTTVYFSAYFRADPNWVFDPAGLDNNFKNFVYSNGSGPYSSGGYWYAQYTGQGTNAVNWGGGWDWNDSSGSLTSPDANGHSHYWWTNPINPFTSGWIKQEYELKITDQTDGYFRIWENGMLKMNYAGHTDNFGNNTVRSIALGGYYRRYGNPSNYRYFSDLYFDTSSQRVLICNGSTYVNRGLCEIQIPQNTWNDNKIEIKINQGTFADNSTGYLYVVDENGNVNSAGKSVFFVSDDLIAPASPGGLIVQ